MERMPISIIVPVYNAEKYLRDTIDSFDLEHNDDVEVICIDDGSTDNSLSILKSYSKKYNIQIFEQKNEGAPSARNKGIFNAKGDYILFFDADDTLTSDALKKLKMQISDKQHDLIVANYYTTDDNGNITGEINHKNIRYAISNRNRYLYLYMIPPFPGNKLYKRSIIEEYQLLFDNVRIGQDLNLYIKYLAVSNSYKLCDDYVANYREHVGSISKKYDERVLDIITSTNMAITFTQSTNDSNRIRFSQIAAYSHLVTQLSKINLYKEADMRNRIMDDLLQVIQITRRSLHAKGLYELYKIKHTDYLFNKVLSQIQ